MRNPYWRISLLTVWLLCAGNVAAQSVDLRLDGTQLRVSAPAFHFITGDTLRRLQDGVSVTLTFQLGTHASRTGAPRDLVTTRFIVSYDLWEEKYAVTRPGPGARSVSYLSLAAAEKWCLDLLAVPVAGMPENSPFWVTLGYRLENPAAAPAPSGSSRMSLGTLIDIFSQRADPRPEGNREITSGPFRLSDLRKNR